MEHDVNVVNTAHSLSLNLSYILNYIPSGILARIRRGQPREAPSPLGISSPTSMSSAIISLVEETGWAMEPDSNPYIDKARQPSLPTPWAFFTSGYMLGLLIVAFVLYRMQNIILPSRTPTRHRQDFVSYLNSRNENIGWRYTFMRHVLSRRIFSSVLPLDISKTTTRLTLQLPSLCILTKMLIIWSLLVVQACDIMPNRWWIRWLGAWSEKKEMSEICWSTFCAIGSAFCVEGFIRALDGMSATFALSSHASPNASPFNLIGYAFLLHIYSSPLTHVRRPDDLPSRPDKHVIITIAIPLLQLTIFHYLSISKRLSSHRLIPTTLTSVLSLVHFHSTLYFRYFSSNASASPSPTILPSTQSSTLSASIPSATNTHSNLQSRNFTTNEFNANYPLLNYIPNLFETALLLTILLTVALNAIVQLLVRGRIERLFIGLGIIHNDDRQSSGWLTALRNLPWDDDFAVLLLRMSTATLEATGLRGWGNEVAPIPTPLPPPLPAVVCRRRQAVKDMEYGHVKMNRIGVESLIPGRLGAVSSSSALGSRFVHVQESAQQLVKRRLAKDERRKRREVLKGYRNEVRTVDASSNSEETLHDGQNEERGDRMLSLERRWIRAFGAFVRALWGTFRGACRWSRITLQNIVWQNQTADNSGKGSQTRLTPRIAFQYAETIEDESDNADEREVDYELYARFLQGDDLGDDDSDDSTFSDNSNEPESESSGQEELDSEQEGDGNQSAQQPSIWERLKEEAMILFSDLIDSHFDEDSSMILAHMAYPRSGGPLTRRRLEYAMRTGTLDDGEDEFERIRMEAFQKVYDSKTSRNEDDERLRHLCVICTIQARDIICWPCRCLAMCDNCVLVVDAASKGIQRFIYLKSRVDRFEPPSDGCTYYICDPLLHKLMCSRRGFRAAFDFLTIFLIFSTTQAALVNRTIDDTYGDSVTGQKPTYTPASSSIWQGPSCTGCAIQPNPSLAFDGTWTAATYNPSLQNINITLRFTGVSIWVFFILPNANRLGTTVTSNTECNFTLDGQAAGSFIHEPNEDTFNMQYNATAFSRTGLSNAPHLLVISTNDVPYNVFLNFDYAIYTTDVPDSATFTTARSTSSSTSSSTAVPAHSSSNIIGIIVGSVFGGLALIVLLFVMLLFRRLRKTKKERVLLGQPIQAFQSRPPTDGFRDDITAHLPWQSTIYSPTEYPAQSVTGLTSLHDRSLSTELGSDGATLVPLRNYQPLHARSAKSRDELRAVRQMEIDQRLKSAQLEMSNLTTRQTTRRPPPSLSGDSARQEETEQEMQSMRAQIRQLRTQIESLQSEQQSDWALGLSDEPPPAYA
ncbi:hypothetical protein APHAL10511_000894 [Amanita phalloides]|nr:hypothetical protein APHAL10511_000894 [Amanita phalloides]